MLWRTIKESFLQANVVYAQEEFKQALYVYQRIDNKGAAVWFNMGNCWYHLKQYVDALLLETCFEIWWYFMAYVGTQ